MAEFKNYREKSREAWGTLDPKLGIEQINCGSMLRIADAAELMAKNHQDLIDSRDTYQRYFRTEKELNQSLRLSNAALKGVITKLKKKLENER